jgi:hypothetical protein
MDVVDQCCDHCFTSKVLRVKSCFLNILINHDTEVVSPICRVLSEMG